MTLPARNGFPAYGSRQEITARGTLITSARCPDWLTP